MCVRGKGESVIVSAFHGVLPVHIYGTHGNLERALPLRSLELGVGSSPIRYIDLFDKMEFFMAPVSQEFGTSIGLSLWAVSLTVTVEKRQS